MEKKKKNPGMETVEHTASTILVIQMVTKNLKERTLSIPYWSFGCLQATWIFVGAVIFLFLCYFFLFRLVFCSHARRVGSANALLPYWTPRDVGSRMRGSRKNTEEILEPD